MDSVFILDTNVFIEAYRKNYPFDVFPGFWLTLKELADNGRIISIDKVKQEIVIQKDELSEWIKTVMTVKFFKSTNTEAIIFPLKQLAEWANKNENNYTSNAVNDFLQSTRADMWLIAYALSIGGTGTIVTQETSAPEQKSKIKIPDVCKQFGIEYSDTIGMLRRLRAKL